VVVAAVAEEDRVSDVRRLVRALEAGPTTLGLLLTARPPAEPTASPADVVITLPADAERGGPDDADRDGAGGDGAGGDGAGGDGADGDEADADVIVLDDEVSPAPKAARR